MMRKLLGNGFVAASLVCGLAHAAGHDPFAPLHQLSLGTGSYDAAGKQLKLGRIEFEFHQGALFPLIDGSGAPIGYAFAGKGRYVYRVDDPLDLTVFQRNLDLQIKNLAHSDRSIYDTFSRALVLLAQPSWQAQVGQPTDTAAPSELERWVEERWAQLEIEWNAIGHSFAESRWNATHRQVAHVEIDGDHAQVIYSQNDERARIESLSMIWKPPGYQWRAYRALSTQTMPGYQREYPPQWELDRVDLDVVKLEKKSGRVRAQLGIKILSEGQRLLGFELINHRDDAPTASWTSTKNKLNVLRVTDPEGRELAFSHRYGELLVDLARTPGVSQRVELTVEIEGEFFTALGGETGDVVVDLSRIGWFPTPTGLATANFTFTLQARCPKSLRPVSSGETIELREERDGTVLRAESKLPVRFVSLLFGKYLTHTVDLGGGRKLHLHGYGLISEKLLAERADMVLEILRGLEHMLGQLPYQEIDFVEDPNEYLQAQYGTSMPGVVLLSTAVFRPIVFNQRGIGTARGAELLIAHEIAHQWFGTLVVPASSYDNWISESLADYLAGMLAQRLGFDDRKKHGRPIRGWSSQFGIWDGYASWCKDWPIEAANLLAGGTDVEDRVCSLYVRGPRVLHMLRGWMGDQAFLTILKRFIAAHANQRVTSDEFAASLSKATGMNLDWFVQDWFREVHEPQLTVTAELQTGADGRQSVVAKATQPGKNPISVFVPLVLTGANGDQSVKLFLVEGANAQATIPVEQPATKVEVDEYKLTLVRYAKPKK
jgi:hypothetical protein